LAQVIEVFASVCVVFANLGFTAAWA